MFKTIPRTSLRGGGCISSPPNRARNVMNNSTRTIPEIPPDFQQSIKELSRRIKESTLTSIDDKGTLMNCFQYFFLNERVFNVLVVNQKLASSNVALLQQIVTDLIESAKIFIKSNPIYCYYCVQISAWIWRVLFWFCTRNDKRYLSVDQHQEYTNQACGIEKELEIEGGGDIYGNSIRYELFVIKTILTIYPTNSAEGQEILQLFAQGAIASLISMTVSDELTEALWKGLLYAVKKGVQWQLKQQYYQIHWIEIIKWQVIDSIHASSNSTRSLINKMMQMYKEIKSSSWEIQYCWIKCIGSIISLKPQLDKSEFNLDQQTMQKLTSQHSIVPITPKIYQVSLDAQQITLSPEAKQLFDQIHCLSKLAEMQGYLLKGYQSFPKFEDYNQQSTEMNAGNTNKNNYKQYFAIQFNNIQIDYYIKKIDATNEMISKITSFFNFKQSNDYQYLEQLFLAKEQIGELIYKLMDINIYYITLEYVTEQWNLYTRPNVDFKIIEKQKFQQQIIIEQLTLIDSIVDQQRKYEDQLKKNTTKCLIDKFDIDNIKEQLINNYGKFNCGNIDNDVKLQVKKLNEQLLMSNISNLTKQSTLTIPDLEYAIQQRLQQCSFAFKIHQCNIRALVQIKTYLKVMISILEDCQQSEFKVIIEQLTPMQETLKLLVLQIIPGSKKLSEELLELIKQINPKEIDNLSTNYKQPSDEVMKTYQIQHYEAISVNLPKMAILSTFYQEYQLKLVPIDIRALSNKIMKLQLILNDLVKQLTNGFQGKQKYIQFMKSITLVIPKSEQESIEFWKTFNESLIEVTQNNESLNSISELQFQLTKRQQQLQMSYQAALSSNPYDTQVTEKQKLEEASLNTILKWIDMIIEIGDQKLANSQNYIDNLVQKIVKLSGQRIPQVETIFNQVNTLTQGHQNKQLPLVEYQNTTQDFDNLTKSIDKYLKYMRKQLEIIQEVHQACQDAKEQEDWLKNIEKYQSEEFIMFCKFSLYDNITDCNQNIKVNTQLQQELIQQIQPTLVNKQSVYDKISEIIKSDAWKIRECMVMQLIRLTGCCLRLEVKQYAEIILMRMKIYEMNKKVRALLNAPQNATQINQVLQQHWSSQQDQITMEIKGSIKQLNSLLYELQQEPDIERRKKLQLEYQEQQNEIQGQLSNVQEVGNSLGITILFIQDLKKDLAKMDQKITEIQENLTNMNTDLQFLRGKTVYQLLEIRRNAILRNKQIVDAQSIYIKTRCVEKLFQTEDYENSDVRNQVQYDQATYLYNADDSEKDGEINEFLIQDKKTLLIHGPAGSGKSTASRKIEEYFWERFDNQTTDAKIVPIFIQLPSLQDPVHSALYETLKSNSYKFDSNQIRELKDEIDKQKLKLLIIIDSYDELHQDYIGMNLIRTNKLSAWGHKNIVNYPKILVTTRSEVLNKSDYHEWFLPEGSDSVKLYKEIRLEGFDNNQRDMYIDCYLSLSVKNVLHESYTLMATQQNEFYLFENFSKLWSTIQINFKDSKDESLLSEQQSIKFIEQMLNDKHISIQNEELNRNLKVQLSELKSGNFYKNTIQLINIEHILETPFMMEIIVEVLPTLIKQKSQPEYVKPHFISAFTTMLIKSQHDNVEADRLAKKAWFKLTKDQSFFEDFSITMDTNKILSKVNKSIGKIYGDTNNKLQLCLVNCLMRQQLTQFDFYCGFFDLYFEKQINKLKVAGKAYDYVSLTKELWVFAQNLAVQLSSQNKTQVEYKAQGLLYKKEIKSWEDEFFDDDCKLGIYKKMFRSCIPMKQQANTFSFNHKSLQEFLVAKDLIDRMEFMIQQVKSSDSNMEQKYDFNQFKVLFENHFINKQSWSVDFMKGACNFIIQRIGKNELLKGLMHRTIQLTKDKCEFIMFGSNSLFLLQKMGECFMDRNIQGIQLQDIDLSASNFAYCNLDNSKMRNVNIAGMNVFNSSLRNVQWTDTQIAQLPPTDIKIPISRVIYLITGELVIISQNQIHCEKEDGSILELYFNNIIIKSKHLHDKEMDYLYLIFESEISIMNLSSSQLMEHQYFHDKIIKVKINLQTIIVLLENSDIIILTIKEQQITRKNINIKSIIKQTAQNDVRISKIWLSNDSKSIIVKCIDLYTVQINEKLKLNSRMSLNLSEIKQIKYYYRTQLALLDSQKLILLNRQPIVEYNAKHKVQLIYLNNNLKEFIVFTKCEIYSMGFKDLKIKNQISHSLDDFICKVLSKNNEMLITLHKNKVAIWNIKQFEQIQILSYTATCCDIDQQMRLLALGYQERLLYHDLKSLTSQKQLNFREVIFANQSSNFIGITIDKEIYYFSVQNENEVKWNLLMKAQGEVFIYVSPKAERALISSYFDKLCIVFDCLKGTKQQIHGYCKNNMMEKESKELFFIKGHQLFRCVDNVATIISPIKKSIGAKLISYFQVKYRQLLINMDGFFYQYELHKSTQSNLISVSQGSTLVISYHGQNLYLIDSCKILDENQLVVYSSYDLIIDCAVMETGLVILHRNKIRLIHIETPQDLISRPRQLQIDNVHQILSIQNSIYAVSDDKLMILNLELMKVVHTIKLNYKINKIIKLKEQFIAIATQNSIVEVWDHNAFSISYGLSEQLREVVDLAYDFGRLVSRSISNQIVSWNVENKFKVEYSLQLDQDPLKYAKSQILINKHKTYIYWIKDCSVCRQELTSNINNQLMVANLQYEYYQASQFAVKQSIVAVADVEGKLHISNDQCRTYEQFPTGLFIRFNDYGEGHHIQHEYLRISNDEQYLLTIQSGICMIWSIMNLKLKKELPYTSVQSAYFLATGDVLILSDDLGTDIFIYNIETDTTVMVAALQTKILTAGPNVNGFYIAHMDSSIDVYAKRRYQEKLKDGQDRQEKGKYNERYVRISVFNNSSNQPIQSYNTDCEGACIQSHLKSSLVELFQQPKHK